MARDDEPAANFSGRIGRDRGGSGVALGLVTVLVIGIAAAVASGRRVEPFDMSDPPGASTAATQSTGPTPRTAPTSTAECDPFDPSGPAPHFRLGSTTFPIGVRGRLGTTRSPTHKDRPDRGWVDPGPEMALAVGPADQVFLVFGTADCIESADIGWRSLTSPDAFIPGLFRVAYATDRPSEYVWVEGPSVDDLIARGIEDREFLLQLRVSWWPDANPEMIGGESWTLLYFRVRISAQSVATPMPRPMVTPAVPCKFFVAEGGVGARLYIPGGSPVFGPPEPENAPLVVAQDGLPLEIRLDGDGCAIDWVVEFTGPGGEDLRLVESVGNSTGDPFLISQNRWAVGVPPPNESLLHIRYRSSVSGGWLDAWWRVLGPPVE